MFRMTMSGDYVNLLVREVAHLESIPTVADAIAKAQLDPNNKKNPDSTKDLERIVEEVRAANRESKPFSCITR